MQIIKPREGLDLEVGLHALFQPGIIGAGAEEEIGAQEVGFGVREEATMFYCRVKAITSESTRL
jgi:hypothetical protein